jgi:Fic family protein
VLRKARFWQAHAQTVLTERQVKILNRLLDAYGIEFVDGIAARQYQSITGVSKATATRDLAELQQKGCLQATGAGGRSARYVIAHG